MSNKINLNLRVGKNKFLYILLSLVLIMLIYYISILSYKIIKWEIYTWLPEYILGQLVNGEEVPDNKKHLIFLMCDHYEPGTGLEGAQFNIDWLEKFRSISDSHHDSYGNNFKYTWFYAYDHKNEDVLKSLSKMAFEGYGEVELHWHHPQTDSKAFPNMLKDAISWFQRYGALITSGENPQTHFGFIHGNWALDNSSNPEFCGVNTEINILKEHGCFADFTFSTIATPSQPETINSIYYVEDDTLPKSYNTGIESQVNPVENIEKSFMIFEGPLGFDFLRMKIEYGAVEDYEIPNKNRINFWIDTNIHVKGRPEWIFVKVYSHGAQTKNTILDEHLEIMLREIKSITNERGIKLHYMSAREAYNIVKAAENGEKGNPEDFRNYIISPYCNMLFQMEVPVKIEKITESEKFFSPLENVLINK